MADELRFDDRVAIVTGAGRGLGRSHALLLAARGAKVVVNDLGCSREGDGSSREPADGVVAEIRAAGGTAIANYSDVSLPAGGETVVSDALQAFGQVDVVIANAGIYQYPQRPFEQTSFETLERELRSHVGGTYNVLRAAWPHMKARGYGRIVTTGSSVGIYGMARCPEYSAAKGGVHALTLALSHEGAEHGIHVNSIGPGAVTRMAADIFEDEASAELTRRHMRPEVVSPGVAWLAHESCTSTGGIFQIHGSRAARVALGEPPGFWDAEMTPETLRDNFDRVDTTEGLMFNDNTLQLFEWITTQAEQRAGRTPSVIRRRR
ncbi:MAG TPA: SDR family NAD(P)-dependent oxidoreductase [Conexibacter sp.]|nr:SDR family NAD(P)-dependent oxidoreductase [Conexibacter sp.]